ncbi:MAG: Rrf2 family transcriptional regulator [Candidatus Omnitrophota bacterium]|jgi:Rrf2 family protein
MKLVTRNIHYAVKSLIYFSERPGQVITVSELVKKLKMRRAFLRRILQALSKRGILKSLKGPSGGFMLNAPADRIRVIDIVSVFRNDMDIFDCLFEKDICPRPGRCPLMREMIAIEKQLNSVLTRLTIKKLLNSVNKQIRQGGMNK